MSALAWATHPTFVGGFMHIEVYTNIGFKNKIQPRVALVSYMNEKDLFEKDSVILKNGFICGSVCLYICSIPRKIPFPFDSNTSIYTVGSSEVRLFIHTFVKNKVTTFELIHLVLYFVRIRMKREDIYFFDAL